MDYIFSLLVLLRQKYRKIRFLKQVSDAKINSRPLKLQVGSSGLKQIGWISSEQGFLNLLRASDWLQYFSFGSLDSVLAEHVWEHLSETEATTAAKTVFKFLKPGGHLRIAVPDGFHPDKNYIDAVKPGGSGSGAFDHKILYTYKLLTNVFVKCGYLVDLLEYHNENRVFLAKEWRISDGFVHRSKNHDARNYTGSLNYTSIIIDAIKPL